MGKGDFLLINANKRHSIRETEEELLTASFRINFSMLAEYLGTNQILFWCNTTADKNEAYEQLRKILDRVLNRFYDKEGEGALYLNSIYYEALYVLNSYFRIKADDSRLKDDALLEQFYDRIIESYEYVGNYLILLIHDAYDVPGRTRDGIEMEDASDEVYDYILTCICPVDLSKPGLSYNAVENTFQNRIRDWVVGMPDAAFLFPAFNDRSTDLHSTLYYSKDAEELKENFVDLMLGCPLPLSAGGQKETFQTLVEETLGNTCDIETVKNIHEKMNELAQEHKEDPEPVVLDKNEVKTIFANSGVANDRMEVFDQCFDATAGEDTSLMMTNVYNPRSFEVKTPDVVIKVNPERTDLVNTKLVDGRQCLVIELDGNIEVNGIAVRAAGSGNGDNEGEE